MRITVAAVGRARDGPLRSLFDGYAGRLPWEVVLREAVEARGPDRKRREAEKLRAALPRGAVKVALDERGRSFDSRALASWIGRRRDEGGREIAFAISGADGLDEAIRDDADLVLSFGAMTWPHGLVRVMLMEQLYRAHAILAGHPYHRG